MSRPVHKYRPFPAVSLPDRRWPSRAIERAPTWCSVDLRDGNQALVEPMGPDRKRRLFDALVGIGIAEIEVGFPAASETDRAFVRELVETSRIPEHVTIGVLTQARAELIDRTFEALRGARRAIVHLYNSTSEQQRRLVFGSDRAGIVEIAMRGAERVRRRAEALGDSEIVYQYSPESFTATEPDFAIEICEAVMNVFEPTVERPLVLNLPATVENAMPNVYADRIEAFARGLRGRDRVVLSVHPHNDRGTAVAAAELAMLAGAERVEGTLFGNGERTGNVDLVTLALNLLTQGVDPGLVVDDIDALVRVAEGCTGLPVHPRHPYAGELVYTAFSGSHQDAIRKGLAARGKAIDAPWDVPYLPIDPADLGRSYQAVVRINSQSGKGGVAYVLERDFGMELPRGLQVELRDHVQRIADDTGRELRPKQILEVFEDEYVAVEGRYALVGDPRERASGDGWVDLSATVRADGELRAVHGRGRGPIEAFVHGLRDALGVDLRIASFHQHGLGSGEDALAMAYVEVEVESAVDRAGAVRAGGCRANAPRERATHFGVGRHRSIVVASLEAVVSALNRALRSH